MRQALNLLTVVSMFALIASATTVARGEDFRIDTDIFIGSSKTPAAEVLTVFHSGNVYDFQLSGSEEITMFEPRRGLLTVIDPKKKQRTTLETIDLLNAAVRCRQRWPSRRIRIRSFSPPPSRCSMSRAKRFRRTAVPSPG